ncbi:MAG: ATP-binding protein [Rubrivivax sp.]|nr:ATP-binding protein [Rubrivivax sp.]
MDSLVRENVRVEQMRMLFETPYPGMALATAFAFALAWHMRGTVPDATLVLWVVLKVVVVLPRAVHAYLFERRRDDSLSWLTWGVAFLLLDGLAWGSAGVLLMAPDSASDMTVIAASLSGISAIAAFAIHADWRACAVFTSSALAPIIMYFLWRGDSFGLYGAASIATFLALLLLAARRSERHVVELLVLRYRNAGLTAELSAALEQAQQESRAKDAFVANMSHELRTPLHGILGLSRKLARTIQPEERTTVAMIRQSGEHLLGIINNILEFSRFKAQGIDVHPTEVDVVRLAEDALAMCMPSAQERGLQLSCEVLLPTPFIALVDPFRLRQVLLNLLGNAIKFTDPGGLVMMRVSEQPAGRGVTISVADTGIGIAPQAMAQLFEPFRQGDASASRRHGGTGLGLHITREICRTMGGDVSCQSVPRRGSVFVVELPLERLSAKTRDSQPDPAVDSGFVVERFGGGTILLAEDNEVNALVAEAALNRIGAQVERVASGRGVVQRMCTHGERPAMVLLDCQMPEMDGFEACRIVRAFERDHGLDRVPIVALTANVFQQDRERCRDAGMDAFLGKPFTEQELHQVLAMFSMMPHSGHTEADTPAPAYAARL